MKAGQGKIKGGEFEREVGRKISLWLSKGQRKDLICRTVLSGGQFTIGAGGNAGDLMAQNPLAFRFFDLFVLECKHWKDIQLIRFLVKDGELYKAMKKVQREAQKKNKAWMLVVRQNHQRVLMLMNFEATQIFRLSELDTIRDFHILFNGEVVMYYLDEFLSTVPPEQLNELLASSRPSSDG